jgi:purine nucleosidase
MAIKVLLDTDIGSDIDDAVALAYLLAQPECDLLGITIEGGEVEKRAQIASAICTAAGKDIPIYPGRETDLMGMRMPEVAEQAVALEHWPHAEHFSYGEAIPFMEHTIRAYPGEVVLLTIAPLTNVAALFASDEDLPHLLKGIVSMCGLFTRRLANVKPMEYNAGFDPYATAIVYRSKVPIHRSIGLDVTKSVTMDARKVRKRFQVKQLQPVLDFAEVWFQENESITFHDPLAATTLFEDHICQFERGEVEVELASDRLAGVTYWKASPTGRHEVAMQVDINLFFEHYFSVF